MKAQKKGLLMLAVVGLVALAATAAGPGGQGGPDGRPGDQMGRHQPPPMVQMTANQQSLFILCGNQLRRYDAATLELKAETDLPDLLPQRGPQGANGPEGRPQGGPQGGPQGERPAPPADQQ